MQKRKIIFITSILFFLFFSSQTFAVFLEQINYQGKLTNKQGAPVEDGGKCMKFRLMDAETGGNEVWSEEWKALTEMVITTKGLFSVMLGKHNSLSNVNFFQPLYLEVQYDPGCDGTYEEVFSPRKPLGAVSASFEAKKLLGYDWASPGIIGATNPNEAYFTRLTVSATSTLSTTTISGLFAVNSNLFYVTPLTNRVGIGTTEPQYRLHIQAPGETWVWGGMFLEPAQSTGTAWNILGGNGGAGFRFYGTGYNKPYATAQLDLGADSSINFLIGNGDSYPTSAMYINNSGNVGIGTISPTYKLDISGNLRATNYVRSETGFCIGDSCITSWGSAVNYWTLNGNYLYPNNLSWNVGIGTSTPAEKLTVEGNILATGNLIVPQITTLVGNLTLNPAGSVLISKSTSISGNLSVSGTATTSQLFVTSTSTLGTVISGVWQGSVIQTNFGGTGLSTIGSSNQILGVKSDGTTLEYKNISSLLLAGSGISISGGAIATISNLGVLSINSATGTLTLQGTPNQINVSTNSGVITLSLPQDIATTSSPTFSNLTLSSLTPGSVLFANSSGLISQDNANFYWDNTNKRLGIGTSSPAYTLDIAGPLRLIPNSQPTGANGVIYYDSALDKFRCYQGGAWTDCIGYSPMRDVIIVDEFVSGLTTSGNIGDLGWLMAAGSVTGQAPSEEKIGILRLSSPATANSRGVLQLSPGTAGVMIIPGQTGDIHIKMVVRNAQAAATACTIRIGLLNTNAAGEASDAIMFRASGTGNWTAVTRAGGTETATNCGVAQTTTFKTFEILINPAFNQVTFIIDGVTCATHTTNIPTVALSPTFKVDTTAATAYGIDIDRFVMVRSPLIRGSDLAEYYYTKDDSIEPGDVVSVDGMILAGVKKSERPYDEKVLGVISTEPGMILGGTSGEGRAVLVALSGRVPVKVSNENGEIKPGDLLTSSNIPGVAIKATEPGRVIGMALESSEKCEREKLEKGECKILMFVNPHWSLGSLTEEGDLSGSKKAANNEQRTILDQFTLAIKRALEKLGLLIENGVAKIEKIFAKEIVVEKIKSEEIETTRIKIKDKATGEIYCLWVENGEIRKGKGDCISLTSQPTTDKTSQPKTEGLQETTGNQQQNLEKESQTSTETTTTPTDEKVIEQSNIENVQESQ